jgi:hypothetical protein
MKTEQIRVVHQTVAYLVEALEVVMGEDLGAGSVKATTLMAIICA